MIEVVQGDITTLEVALEQGDIRSIAFPVISTGVYGYPGDQVVQIAVRVIREYEPQFDSIVACTFSQEDAERYRQVLEQ